MIYQGSKTQFAQYIVPRFNDFIQTNHITIFYDLFCGGANIADRVNCEEVIANDLSPTLIALHKQAQQDFSQIPRKGSREIWDKCYTEYKRLKKSQWTEEPQIPLYEIGAIEWYGSYGARGFPGSYAKDSSYRHYYLEHYKNHQTQASTNKYKKIKFVCGDYRDVQIKENQLIYCDPPCNNNNTYYDISKNFDHEAFYEWVRRQSKTNPIFISAESMPNDFEVVWEKKIKGKNCVKYERLYFMDNR